MCQFTAIFGITCLSFAKLSLHLFVAVRSQIVRNETSSIWFKIGLVMIMSDVLYILYILSGIPIIISAQNEVLCALTEVSLSVYIWFAMNDFVIGCYCLFAFIVPLRKYVLLEGDGEEYTVTKDAEIQKTNNNSELKTLITRIMIYSSIALVSTMITTVVSSIVHESAGPLFGIDSVINAVCVIFQFSASDRDTTNNSFTLCPCNCNDSETKLSTAMKQSTPVTNTPTNTMVIHDHSSLKTKPELQGNVSLSVSLVEDEDTCVV
eukprot:UN01939